MSSGISRRSLVAGAAVAGLAGSVAVAGADEAQVADANPAAEVAQPMRNVRVHDFDVVVLGGGITGNTAAMRALQLGANVAIVDKAQFGRSGTSGFNWGAMYTTYDFCGDPAAAVESKITADIRSGQGVSDQFLTYLIATTLADTKMTLLGESLGMFHERMEDGKIGTAIWGERMGDKGDASMTVSGIYHRFFAQRAKKLGAHVYDNCMALDVLVNEANEVAGAIALDLRSGEVQVFRAKAVIIAMGTYNWMCGWVGNRPQSMCGPESTGDSAGILWRRGLKVGNLEFCSTDNNMWDPGCLRLTFGLGLEWPDADRALNSEGRYFVKEFIEAGNVMDQGIECLEQMIAGEVVHGRGSEHGGVWLDTANWSGDEMEVFYRRTPDNLWRNFGYELPDKVEVCPEHWSSYYAPQVDTTLQTQIPGLFYAGTVKISSGIEGAIATGQIAAQNAALRAATTERPAVDWAQVDEVVAHTYDLLERNVEGGLKPFEVMRKIQLAYQDGLNLIRNEEGIQAALDEFRRIKAEDVPAMTIPNKTRVFNLEWRHALEVENMVNCAIGAAMAALERRESRYMHVRTDYPARDNENFLKRFMVGMEGDEFTMEAVVPDMSIISDPATLDMLLPGTNINSIENWRNAAE